MYNNNKKHGRIVESIIISNYNTETGFYYQLDFLFGEIGAAIFQNPLFKIIRLHHLYIFRKIDKQIEIERSLTLTDRYIMEC